MQTEAYFHTNVYGENTLYAPFSRIRPGKPHKVEFAKMLIAHYCGGFSRYWFSGISNAVNGTYDPR